KALNIFELEELAKAGLPKLAHDYFASGAWDEVTLRENQCAFNRIQVHYRVLVDVSKRNMGSTLLGQKLALPVLIAPTAFHKLAHAEGELAVARAAGAAGTIMTLSSLSTTRVEEVTAAASGPVWFQLYINKDRGFTRDLVARVKAAGCQALMLTVDTPEWGRREQDVRNGFHLPEGLSAVNLLPSNECGEYIGQHGAGMGQAFTWMLDASLTWKDVDWLCGLSDLPVVIKGICRPDDAERALAHGAGAIVVSNHGGRQMDTAPATIEVLPAVAQAVAGRVPVLLDGGIRRGVDVLKALALGASAVQIGRPVLWGLAAGGQAGVELALELLRRELDLAMALAGCGDLGAITRDLVKIPGEK
ncbi:MAG: FMN-dependent alpha-hydroxy acid dehydrogenase, partial [Pedosphaera sp.]|nr:FMN-dependent alpha-hydroxy acid dehydrogenase [Pedosphaera sp.]